MGTDGEYWADGVPKCKCGCRDLIVRISSSVVIDRDKDLTVISEYYDDEQDTDIICRKCKTELK